MKRPRPKYQVFISSTFSDLKDEREKVTWEILKLHHIPAGMETFPAADDRGWATIQKVIDDSDYYVLLIAGRYGSVDPESGLSWTHKEYRYARNNGIPVFAFIRSPSATTADKMETEADKATKLSEFKTEIKNAHLVQEWKTTDELINLVGQALHLRIGDDEYGDTPRPGWYRGDAIPSFAIAEELSNLSSENRHLREELAAHGKLAPQLLLRLGSKLVEERPYYKYKPDQYEDRISHGPLTENPVNNIDSKN